MTERQGAPDVSIIVVSWNTRRLLAECLGSVGRPAGDLEIEIIVVDNGSTDGSPDIVRRQFPHVRLVENERNVGFAAANNQGMALGRGRYLLLLNSDAFVTIDSLQTAVDFVEERPDVGVCGGKLLNPDGTFQGSYADFPTLKSEFLLATGLGVRLASPYYPAPRPWPGEEAHEVDWIGGAFMLLRRKVFEQVGGMDEMYWMYSEETDWCYRIKQAGWRIYYLPQVAITHVRGGSTRRRGSEMVAQLYKSKVRFFAKNYGSASARRLRALFWLIFLVREMVSRFMLLSLPPARSGRWRYELRTARLVRDACAHPLSTAR
jgi:N-acetylglucosaminyl-diphospho-decaprenol L-rhamnosyltransferase